MSEPLGQDAPDIEVTGARKVAKLDDLTPNASVGGVRHLGAVTVFCGTRLDTAVPTSAP